MSSCICLGCQHLKSVLDVEGDENGVIVEVCDFGFPSEDCYECTKETCELTCEHFEEAVCEEDYVQTTCVLCDKSLSVLKGQDLENNYCVDCYLKK